MQLSFVLLACIAVAQKQTLLEQAPNTWVKRSPLANTPPSPMLGYEGSFGYDPQRKLLIRWAGHNQGGGGEQNAETWTFDPLTARWTLREPNLSPPGVCCAQQNVFDAIGGRFLRFQAFSGSHGWQWFREIYLNNTSVWSYDLATDTWRDMRAYPAPRTAPLRCASWDSEHEMVVIFGGEGSHEGTVVYDPYLNTWKRMKPASEPAERSGGNMAYDAARKRHILFGTQFGDDPHTWAYDLNKNEWTDLQPQTMPPTNESDPVLAYDPHSQQVICVVQVVEKNADGEGSSGRHETWAYDAKTNRWTKMNPPQEPQGWGNRRRIIAAIPDQNLVLLESYVNPTTKIPGIDREQQIWTYRYGDASSQPIAPSRRVRKEPRLVEDLVVSVISTKEARLAWPKSDAPDLAGYHVERAIVEPFSEDQIERLRKDTPPLEQPSVGAFKRIGPVMRLTAEPIKQPSYTDRSIDLEQAPVIEGEPVMTSRFAENQLNAQGKPYRFGVYAYRVRAVNKLGLESGPGPLAYTIPSSPQYVFAKEDRPKCHLKWRANPEEGLRGYRVYRMESPRINGPGQKTTRVTLDPIPRNEFSDPDAGNETRRYWIVAVDALGQEGFPSAPVWHERQYKRIYDQFTGEWHQ